MYKGLARRTFSTITFGTSVCGYNSILYNFVLHCTQVELCVLWFFHTAVSEYRPQKQSLRNREALHGRQGSYITSHGPDPEQKLFICHSEMFVLNRIFNSRTEENYLFLSRAYNFFSCLLNFFVWIGIGIFISLFRES